MNANIEHPNVCEHPLDTDVLYGRGGRGNNHPGKTILLAAIRHDMISIGLYMLFIKHESFFIPYATHFLTGNIRFRSMVDQFKKQYEKCSRHEKTALAESLVRKWRAQSPPGRFLKLDDISGLWEDVGKEARRKCSQLLREGASKNKQDDKKSNSPKHGSAAVTAPPANVPPEIQALCESPPKRKPSPSSQKKSPTSIMDNDFFGAGEVEEKDTGDDDSQCESVFSGIFAGLSLPRLPGHRKRDKTVACHGPPSPDSISKDRTALQSFLTDMLREKAATLGAQDICILQDNANVSPKQHKEATVDDEIVYQVTVPKFRDYMGGAKHGGTDSYPQIEIRPHEHPTKITPSKRST